MILDRHCHLKWLIYGGEARRTFRGELELDLKDVCQ